MPTLPTAYDLGFAVPSPSGHAPHAPSMGEKGQALAHVGSVVSGIADDELKKIKSLELIKAEAEHQKGMYEINRDLAADPDYSTHDQKFQERAGALNQRVTGMVSDPYARQHMTAMLDMRTEDHRNHLLNNAAKLRRADQAETLKQSIDNHLIPFGDPGSTEAQRDRSMKAIEDAIKLARGSGLVTPLEAVKMLRGYKQQADEVSVRSKIGRLDDTVFKDLSYTPQKMPGAEKFLSLSARLETGKDPSQGLANISPDAKGTKSYGNLGLNSGGSAQQFVASYGGQFGFTAKPGTKEFDAQWKQAAAEHPKELQAAELDWYNKNIMPRISTDLQQAGIPEDIATDPRVQSYFSDRLVQYGPNSINNHAARIEKALSESGGDAVSFLKAMSTVDRDSLKQDFPSALASGRYSATGHQNRIAGREKDALEIEGTLYGGPYKHLTPQKRVQLLNIAKVAFRATAQQDLQDSLKIIEDTGAAPVDERGQTALDRSKLSLTVNEFAKAQQHWRTAQGKYSAVAPLGNMSVSDARDHLDKLRPNPDDPDYAINAKIEEHAWKVWHQMEDQRDADPASVVEGSKEVMEAKTQVRDIGARSTVLAGNEQVIAARLAAQQRLGVYRPQPITEAEARDLIRLPKNPSAEDIEAELSKGVKRAQAMYGRYAKDAMRAAIAFEISNKDNRQLAVDLADGLMAEKPAAPPSSTWWESIFGKSETPATPAEKPGQTTLAGGKQVNVPNKEQIKWLNSDFEGRRQVFEQKFGPGTANDYLER